uniref:Gustatory receptor n=1 Tax=viral metagenome TaxID=1070528 RepID=A0A6C0LDG2_9ZZZZ
MLYNYLLFFLGIYSWNYKSTTFFERLLQKKVINLTLLTQNKNNKKLIKFNETDSNSPNLNFYLTVLDLKELSANLKYKIYVYNLYSLLIFIFLCIEPFYLFYKLCSDTNNFQEYLITFLININTPINYLWAKYYFSTNHFDLFVNSCNYNCWSFVIFIIIITCISIVISLIDIDSFYNEYYYIHNLNKTIGITIVILEWIYSRLLFALTSSAFTIVFCKHVKQIRNFIKQIISNEFDLEDSYCLTSLISNIASLRHSVEISIKFYNKLLSCITVTGGVSLAIFIRHLYNKTNTQTKKVIILQQHEQYLLQSYILYVICQLIFFYNVIYYSELRNRLVKLIQSSSFINKFLIRWSASRLKKKCKDTCEIKQLCKIILCIEQENATSIDWMILEKLTRNKWMDFSILGISTQDGTLIKKVITFSSLIYFILSYLQ